MKIRSLALRFASMLTILLLLAACSSPQKVVVLVEVPRRTGVPDITLDQGFKSSLPRYQNIEGLERKYFTRSDSHFGGVYLWNSKDAANAFYNKGWVERIQSTYGASPRLTYFDAPLSTPGGSPDSAGPNSLVTIVRVPAPWYAPRSIIARRMEGSIPQYNSVPGLVYKYFTIASEKNIGGIYLWDEAASADAFYNTAWHKRINDTYGVPADVMRLNAPALFLKQL